MIGCGFKLNRYAMAEQEAKSSMEFRSLPNLFIEPWLQKVKKLCAKFLSQAKS